MRKEKFEALQDALINSFIMTKKIVILMTYNNILLYYFQTLNLSLRGEQSHVHT